MLRDSSISYVQQKKNWAVGYKRERTDLRLKKNMFPKISLHLFHSYNWRHFLPLVIFVTKGRMALPNRMNFRKNSKRPSTPPSFSENYEVRGPDSMKCLHMISRDRVHSEGWGVGVNCRLERFRKVIQFGSVTRPLNWND